MKLSLIEKLLYTVEFNVQISIIIIRDTIWFVRFVSWKYNDDDMNLWIKEDDNF